MEEYEVHCSPEPETARVFAFANYRDAKTEAERLCREYRVSVKIVRIIGRWVSDPRWISYGVPGYD